MLTSGVENDGMKYLTIIAWHPEGFQMYGWTATPFHRDPIKELAAGCQWARIN